MVVHWKLRSFPYFLKKRWFSPLNNRICPVKRLNTWQSLATLQNSKTLSPFATTYAASSMSTHATLTRSKVFHEHTTDIHHITFPNLIYFFLQTFSKGMAFHCVSIQPHWIPLNHQFSDRNQHWLVVSTPLKNMSQLGLLFNIYGKMFQTTNQNINQPESLSFSIPRPQFQVSPAAICWCSASPSIDPPSSPTWCSQGWWKLVGWDSSQWLVDGYGGLIWFNDISYEFSRVFWSKVARWRGDPKSFIATTRPSRV